MDTSKLTGLNFRKIRRSRAAFSLVEVTMAIGIVAFAFISVLGMVPTGLKTFRLAIDATVGSQIIQRVINEAQQSDFDQLIADKDGNPITTGSTGLKATRYFDDQGNEVAAAQAIYEVKTRITPATTVPENATYPGLATVAVQVANNPAGRQSIRTITDDPASLWSDPRFPIATYSGIVARNK